MSLVAIVVHGTALGDGGPQDVKHMNPSVIT